MNEWKQNEEFIRLKRAMEESHKDYLAFSKALKGYVPPPYYDIERIVNLRRLLSNITQEEIGKILGITKQGWSAKEKAYKEWRNNGKKEQKKYKNDMRLTADQMKQLNVLAAIKSREADVDLDEKVFSDFEIMFWNMEAACRKDAVLTEELLDTIVHEKRETLLALRKVAFVLAKSSSRLKVYSEELVWLLRGAIINELDNAFLSSFPSDNEIEIDLDIAKERAELEVKRKYYQKEFEEILKTPCTQAAVHKNGELRRRVSELAACRDLPEDSEETVWGMTRGYFTDRVCAIVDKGVRKGVNAALNEIVDRKNAYKELMEIAQFDENIWSKVRQIKNEEEQNNSGASVECVGDI